MKYRAYNAFNKDKLLEIVFRPNPIRWNDNFIGENNPIRNVANWSSEIKYLRNGKISKEIKNIPKDTGGIYMFYLKGINLPFAEYYKAEHYIHQAKIFTKEQCIISMTRDL